MNIHDVKELKTTYENAIKQQIAEVLNVQQEAVEVNWTLEYTDVQLSLYGQNNITRFMFHYTENDFVISNMSYQPVMDGDMVTGIVAGIATITLATIQVIESIIKTVLNEGVNEDASEGEADA